MHEPHLNIHFLVVHGLHVLDVGYKPRDLALCYITSVGRVERCVLGVDSGRMRFLVVTPWVHH